jgi:hypothetical protein
MIFVVSPDTVRNVKRLNLRRIGGQMLGRGFRVVPRRPLRSKVFWRILFDQSPTRYALALSPFPIAMLLRPDLALGISQAPLLMFGLVFLIESSVLSVQGVEKRRALIGEAEAARAKDQLVQRGRDVLGRIAAGRDMKTETLHLVVEQSGLARVPILTLVSVQAEPETPGGRPVLLDLGEDERAMIAERLFGDGFDEAVLHRVNLQDNAYVRTVALESRTVSAHARLLAMAR